MLSFLLRRTRWVFMPVLGGLAYAGLGLLTPTALASRFDPPWQSRVVVDQTTLYSQADRGSAPVGPLLHGQVVVVVNELTGTDGKAWTQVPDGFVRSSDIAEDMTPWIARSHCAQGIDVRPPEREGADPTQCETGRFGACDGGVARHRG